MPITVNFNHPPINGDEIKAHLKDFGGEAEVGQIVNLVGSVGEEPQEATGQVVRVQGDRVYVEVW